MTFEGCWLIRRFIFHPSFMSFFYPTAKFGSHRRGRCPDCRYRARRGPPGPHQQLPVQRRERAGHPLQRHSCAREPPRSTGLPDHHTRRQVQHLQKHWEVGGRCGCHHCRGRENYSRRDACRLQALMSQEAKLQHFCGQRQKNQYLMLSEAVTKKPKKKEGSLRHWICNWCTLKHNISTSYYFTPPENQSAQFREQVKSDFFHLVRPSNSGRRTFCSQCNYSLISENLSDLGCYPICWVLVCFSVHVS